MRKPPLQDVIVKPGRGPEPRRDSAWPSRTNMEDVSHPVHPVRRPVREEGVENHSYRGEAENAYAERPPREPSPSRPSYDYFASGSPTGRTSRKWLFMALGIGAVVILSSVALSLMFAGATITVYPKQDSVVIDTTFTAALEGEEQAFPFERVVIERTAERSVIAQGEQQVEERAEGLLTIYNEYSITPQRLIKRTRFESEDGRIYRIQNAVEVPGKQDNGTPGSVEVRVVAEEPGESYNITGSHAFSIPGFVGTPQEGKVYAKSTEDFAGGFAGIRRTVGEAERVQAVEQLEAQLRDELLAAAFTSNDHPPEYFLSKDAVFFEFNTMPDTLVESDKVTVSLSGKLHGVLFDRDSFAARIARGAVASYNGEPLRIETLNDLSLQLQPVVPDDDAEVVAPWEAASYIVRVQGKTHFIWEFDENALARDLAGLDEAVLDSPYEGGVLERYVGIDRLQASIRPFWKNAFPSSPEDIVIITKLDG